MAPDIENCLVRIYDQNNKIIGAGILIPGEVGPGTRPQTESNLNKFFGWIPNALRAFRRLSLSETAAKESLFTTSQDKKYNTTRCYILTCSHVVIDKENNNKTITVDFPFLSQEKFSADILRHIWVDKTEGGDMALLQIMKYPLQAYPSQLFNYAVANRQEHRFNVYGFPEGHNDGIWVKGKIEGKMVGGWIQVESETGHTIQPGFSGSPVWDEQLKGVIGMVVGCDWNSATKTAYMIPTTQLETILPVGAKRNVIRNFNFFETPLLSYFSAKTAQTIYKSSVVISVMIGIILTGFVVTNYIINATQPEQKLTGAAGVQIQVNGALDATSNTNATGDPTDVFFVLDQDSCSLTLEIFDKNNKLISSAKVNAGDSYQITLPPGEYSYIATYNCIDLAGAAGANVEEEFTLNQEELVITLPSRQGFEWP
jgi:hypothetical protein